MSFGDRHFNRRGCVVQIMNNSTKVTMQDIADQLNISKNAVSLAINNKPGVSSETRGLVLKTAHKLGYGRTTTSSISKKILVMLPEYIHNDSYFYNEIYWSIDKSAKQRGYTALMVSISLDMENQMQLPNILSEMQFAGIILVGVFSQAYTIYMADHLEHLISVDQYYLDVPIHAVVTDNLDSAYRITHQALTYGHTKLGFVGAIGATSSIFDRYAGFIRALYEAEILLDSRYCILNNSPLQDLMSNPDGLFDKLSIMEKLPTVFVCGGDRIAISLIEALKRMGKRIPQDISVVGIDNLEISSIIHPSLTTMNIDRKLLGRITVELLLSPHAKTPLVTKTCIGTSLVLRNSLGRPPI
jgi:DNA-binding LacI/PurR family transcriptional regulator